MRGPIMCNGRFNGHLVVEWQFGRCRAALIGKGEDGTWWMLCREAGFLTSVWKFATHADAIAYATTGYGRPLSTPFGIVSGRLQEVRS